MAKEKKVYICTKCSAKYMRWAGKCEACGEWNTLEEKIEIPSSSSLSPRVASKLSGKDRLKKNALPAKKNATKKFRQETGIKEFDRVLGGGFFPGSITLLTGDPGIGKSTITLQACLELAKKTPEKKVILISGEESVDQVSERIFRISKDSPENFLLLSEGILEHALSTIENEDIGFLLFDSVQTLSSLDVSSAPGSITQAVAVTEKLMTLAKEKNIPTLLIGHVTKAGEMAGPQTMAHLVDTVLHIEGEKFSEYRILRSKKNRFGSVFEMGVFEMTEKGLQEVKNPSKNFLAGRLSNALGSAIFPAVEGTRPFLVEVQALTKHTSFGYPKRSTSGFDTNRLSILIAVLGRYTGMKLESEDVFVNIVGGIRISEPAADLAIIASIISSKKKVPLPQDTVFLGEVGLSGEIRQVANAEKRLKESEKLGFKKAILPKSHEGKVKTTLQCKFVRTVSELSSIISQ